MTGTGRTAIEARLVALRNIQTLIDAALLQFQYLSSILPILPQPPQQFYG